VPPDKGGDKKVAERSGAKGRAGERNVGETRGKGLPSVPTVPNLPLYHWSTVETLCCQMHIELLGQYRQMTDDKLCNSSSAYSWHNMDI